jgi:hypothetical protein
MKHILHPLFFIQKCKIITNKLDANDFFQQWPEYIRKNKNIVSFKYVKRNAEKRNLTFLLTKDEYTKLCEGKCYLCGVSSFTLGIDRKDPSRGYIKENSYSCCGTCNMMKASFTYDEFMKKVEQISHCNQDILFRQIPKIDYQMGGAKKESSFHENSKLRLN